MKTLLVKAQMTGSPSRVKDRSVNLKFQTLEEISNEDFALMDDYFKQNGWLAFKTDEIEVEDIPAENAKIKGEVSRSKQLRYKIFALHMKKGGKKDNFQPFYERYMDRIDRAVQEELDQLED